MHRLTWLYQDYRKKESSNDSRYLGSICSWSAHHCLLGLCEEALREQEYRRKGDVLMEDKKGYLVTWDDGIGIDSGFIPTKGIAETEKEVEGLLQQELDLDNIRVYEVKKLRWWRKVKVTVENPKEGADG